MKSITVKILDNYISKNIHYADSCPVAQGIKAYGLGASVNIYSILVTDLFTKGWMVVIRQRWYHTPPLISDWIKTYDDNKTVLPIEFELLLDNPFKSVEYSY